MGRRGLSSFSRIATGTSLIVGAVCCLDACERRIDPESDASDVVSRLRESGVVVDGASEPPPSRLTNGYRLAAMDASQERGTPRRNEWREPAGGVTLDLDERSGQMVVSGRRGNVRATRVASHPATFAVEGSKVVGRSAGGALETILLVQSRTVEELVVQNRPGEPLEYDLDLPTGWALASPPGFRGVVEIRDARGRAAMRMIARAAWDATGRSWPVTARIHDRHVLFEVPADAEYPLVVDPEWQDASSPIVVRARATATVLSNGNVLLVGGEASSGNEEAYCTSEIYESLDGTWTAGPVVPPSADGSGSDAAQKCTPIMDAVAVPLPDGTVLLAGGANRTSLIGAGQPAAMKNAWIYDPARSTFTPTGSMVEPRVHFTGTLLRSGKVLITGGTDRQTPLDETAFKCQPMNGQECKRCVGTASAELYDPTTRTFSEIAMPTPRACHTATLLPDDSVLLVGGGGPPTEIVNVQWGTPLKTLSLYKDGVIGDLPTSLNVGRFGHVAVLNPAGDQVLVAMGRDDYFVIEPQHTPSLAEIIDLAQVLGTTPPATTIELVCATLPGGCPPGRSYPSATVTADGKALIVGGQEKDDIATAPSKQVDAFDFVNRVFEARPPLSSAARKPVLTTLPNKSILLLGETVPPKVLDDETLSFATTTPPTMSEPRSGHSITPLSGGKFFIAGGQRFNDQTQKFDALDTAEIFDANTMTSTPVANKMHSARSGHSATRLPGSGGTGERVLIAGGQVAADATNMVIASATAEIFDPATGTFEATGSMKQPRAYHTATRLRTGELLFVGGLGNGDVVERAAELYDPAKGTFSDLPVPAVARALHTATLLYSGDVLIAGGYAAHAGSTSTGERATLEIFDAVQHTFRTVGNTVVARGAVASALLHDGKVLLAGGTVLGSAELFDPATGTSRLTLGGMNEVRVEAGALTLPSGEVLIAGGSHSPDGFSDTYDDAELFDPISEQFQPICPPETAPAVCGGGPEKLAHYAFALLPNGMPAAFGGALLFQERGTTNTIRIFTPGPPPSPAPELDSAPSLADPGVGAPLTGLRLTSGWQTSSGPYPSPAGWPVALWLPTSGPPVVSRLAPWSDANAVWTPRASTFAGHGLLFAARGGQQSAGLSVDMKLAALGVACDSDAACETGFCSDGVCCNERCHVAGDSNALCRSCSVATGAAQDGTCGLVAENTDPHQDCADIHACAAGTATCNGQGQCKPCRCDSKLGCADGYACTVNGTCERAPTPDEPTGCVASAPPTNDEDATSVLLVAFGLAAARYGARRRRAAR